MDKVPFSITKKKSPFLKKKIKIGFVEYFNLLVKTLCNHNFCLFLINYFHFSAVCISWKWLFMNYYHKRS